MPAARSQVPPAESRQPVRWTRPDPVTAAIVIMTALGLALRLYQLSRPDYLIGVTEYDDGTDFGSAVLLIHGDLPYRDFIMVQPPGITLLMAPVALVAKGIGTAWGMGVGRILTALAGAAVVAMGGLLVRHRGLLAVIAACGILAVYPAAVQAAHTVLLEPWLVLFCLAGAVAVFDGDGLTDNGRRLAKVILAAGDFGRPIVAAPGVPAERMKILRDSFDKTIADPAFLAEAEKRRLEIDHTRWDEMESLAKDVMATPPEIVARMRKLLGE